MVNKVNKVSTILNLYAGIGGNRRLWGDAYEVVAVESDERIAEVYSALYPNDIMLVGDALEALETISHEFDFIWSSPPCQSHGQYRHNVGVLGKGYTPLVPDMTSLYGQIVFLQTYYRGLWVVENTVPYYTPLIPYTAKLQRHLFWSNFDIPVVDIHSAGLRTKNKISDFDSYEVLDQSKIPNKRQVLRNCVDAQIGLHILECAIKNDREGN